MCKCLCVLARLTHILSHSLTLKHTHHSTSPSTLPHLRCSASSLVPRSGWLHIYIYIYIFISHMYSNIYSYCTWFPHTLVQRHSHVHSGEGLRLNNTHSWVNTPTPPPPPPPDVSLPRHSLLEIKEERSNLKREACRRHKAQREIERKPALPCQEKHVAALVLRVVRHVNPLTERIEACWV